LTKDDVPTGLAVYDRPTSGPLNPKTILAVLLALAASGFGLFELLHHHLV
jgi:hypothetical protein